MTTLSICHFNDVYRVTPQKISPTSADTIDVTQFAALLDAIREQWPEREDGKRDGEPRFLISVYFFSELENEGLVLFSGDVFSPSTESSVSRGSHMVGPAENIVDPRLNL